MLGIYTKTLGIRGRLAIGFTAVIIVLIVSIGITLYQTYKIRDSEINVLHYIRPLSYTLGDLTMQVYASSRAERNYLLTTDPKFKTERLGIWNELEQDIVKIDAILKQQPFLIDQKSWGSVKVLINQLNEVQIRLEKNVQPINNLADFRSSSTYAILINEANPLVDKILGLLKGQLSATGERVGGMRDTAAQMLTVNAENLIKKMNMLQISQWSLLGLGVILSIFITIITSQWFIKYFKRYSAHVSEIAAGDLTKRIRIENNDELSLLGKDLNLMTENLANVSKEITKATHNMMASLDEVKNAIESQSSGASEQAASINQITATLEEIEKSSNQTLEKAKKLGDISQLTKEKSQKGLDAVDQSVNGMSTVRNKVQIIAQTMLDLSNQSKQIGEITGLVNTLAQQSKMLALNASIEAAKAGEAGKGFAVVAAEVKTLAEQSEQATAQVQKILQDISHATEKAVMAVEEGTKGVDEGTQLVEKTGEIVRGLNEVVHETSAASQQISAAVRQESVGIEQITSAMGEINKVTTSFVASVKQTDEAIGSLLKIAQSLKEHIEVYKI